MGTQSVACEMQSAACHLFLHVCTVIPLAAISNACMTDDFPRTVVEDLEEDGINLAAPKRRKRTWEEASDKEDADPEAMEAAQKEAEMEADRYCSHLASFALWRP